jgi:hypothetical protein
MINWTDFKSANVNDVTLDEPVKGKNWIFLRVLFFVFNFNHLRAAENINLDALTQVNYFLISQQATH